MTALLVVAGAVLGAPLRVWVTRTAARLGRDVALGTLLANVVGSAVLGVVLGRADVSVAAVTLVGTGFCGALTTFSTFGADVVRLVEERSLTRAVAYLAATLVLGLGAAAAGYVLARD